MRASILIAACAASITINAQVRISGQVLGRGDAPLAGAAVTVGTETELGAATDPQGRFTLRGVAEGASRLHVRMMGYRTLDTTVIAFEGMAALTLRLQEEAIPLPATEVVALRAGDRAPFAKSVVTRERIERINTGVDLPYVLEQQPGTVSTSDGGTGIGYTYMRIRGTDGTRTNITVNGVPFNDPESQGAFLVNMPDLVTSAEDIEVQRGVGTSTNGPAAFGATVNVRTTAVKRAPWGLLSASGGSLNLAWPATHLGWILQTQTNALSTGLTTPTNTWFDVAGSASATNTSISINAADPTVVFRQRKP